MTVKSLFIPPYALQGEDIPGHITWDEFNFRYIRIELPRTMLKKQLYNVLEEMVETVGHTIIIRNKAIEVDGYIGMLFSSKKIENSVVRSRILFSFIGENDVTLFKQSREIYLFRPNLELVEIPSEIKVDTEKGFVHNRIKARKNEEGTLLLKFRSVKDSEIEVRTPSSIIEYRKRLIQNIKDEYAPLRKKYPSYSDYLESHISMLEKGWMNQEDLKKIKELATGLRRIGMENEAFTKELFMALMNSYWRSQRFLSVPERLLKYLESVTHKKIWLSRPENVITVCPEPRILKLEIMPSDLLLDAYDIVKIPSIRITGDKEGEIEVAKLFEWV